MLSQFELNNNNQIIVDENCHTSISNIYAIDDSSFDNKKTKSINNAFNDAKKAINHTLKYKSKTNKLIVIVMPTSSNKTELARKINEKFNFPLVNAGAFQVYKELNYGRNKMNKNDIKNMRVYLMDSISIYDEWNIKKCQFEANKIIDNIYKNKKIPIIVGGSNLYVDVLIKKYYLSSSNARSNKYENLNNKELSELLKKLDLKEAQKIPINNRRRIIRALEIIDDTEVTKSQKDFQRNVYFDCLIIYMDVPREILYKTINENVIKMIKKGWKNELKGLLLKDKNIMHLTALKATAIMKFICQLYIMKK